ncbi:MAG TPA: DUF1801 domain-containing protein [Caulobacteraceae bacterium]|nr:DUF1801 domain-containing protein [Caulobacteraceae bacterium]
MSDLFRLSGGVRRDPEVDAWFAGAVRLDPEIDAWLAEPADALRRIARTWFDHMRGCGDDVRELVHDRYPVACVGDAAFGYVNAFKAHVNVGFFYGATLDDPAGLLEGAGKRMRHAKVRLAQPVNEPALSELIATAYRDIRLRLGSEGA